YGAYNSGLQDQQSFDKLEFIGHRYGFVPTSISPVFSSSPNIKFIFCTACPAAPFTRLSKAENTTTSLPRTAKPISQKLVVLTQLMSGDPFTSLTKKHPR